MIIEETKISILEKILTEPKPIKVKQPKRRIKLIVGLGNPGKK